MALTASSNIRTLDGTEVQQSTELLNSEAVSTLCFTVGSNILQKVLKSGLKQSLIKCFSLENCLEYTELGVKNLEQKLFAIFAECSYISQNLSSVFIDLLVFKYYPGFLKFLTARRLTTTVCFEITKFHSFSKSLQRNRFDLVRVNTVDNFCFVTVKIHEKSVHATETNFSRNIFRDKFYLPKLDCNPLYILNVSYRLPSCVLNSQIFWNNLKIGASSVCTLPPFRARYFEKSSMLYVTKGGYLNEPVDSFDANFFGLKHNQAIFMDPQQRWLLETAFEILEPSIVKEKNIGIYVGASNQDFHHLVITYCENSELSAYTECGVALAMLAGRLSSTFDLRGPALVIDTLCSSSAVALHAAFNDHTSTCMLTCGVNACLTSSTALRYCRMGALSPEGLCKSWDANADGFVKSDGCVSMLLSRKDLSQFGVLVSGSNVNQNGAMAATLTSASAKAQSKLWHSLLTSTRFPVDQVQLIEAHGTGTQAGDSVEIQAVNSVFASSENPNSLIMTSSKTVFGHTESASGLVGVGRVLRQVQENLVTNHLHFCKLNCKIKKVCFYLPLINEYKSELKVGFVSSFGISGTNAAVALILQTNQNYKKRKNNTQFPNDLILVSAKCHTALLKRLSQLKTMISGASSKSISDLALASRHSWIHFPHRFSFTTSVLPDFACKPNCHNLHIPLATQRSVFLFGYCNADIKNFAFQLANVSKLFRKKIEALKTPNKWQNETARLICTELAAAELWEDWGVKDQHCFGVGVAELAAAVRAKLLNLQDALKVAHYRELLLDENLSSAIEVNAKAHIITKCFKKISEKYGDSKLSKLSNGEKVVFVGNFATINTLFYCITELELDVQQINKKEFYRLNPASLHQFFEICNSVVSTTASDRTLISSFNGNPLLSIPPEYWCHQTVSIPNYTEVFYYIGNLTSNMSLELSPYPKLTELAYKYMTKPNKMAFVPSFEQAHQDWHVVLKALSVIYSLGGKVNWKTFDHFNEISTLQSVLPLYPYQKNVKYWPKFSKLNENKLIPKHNLLDFPSIIPKETTFDDILKAVHSLASKQVDISIVDCDAGFIDIGMDSLMLSDFQKDLENQFSSVFFTSTAVFEWQTVNKMAEYIFQQLKNVQINMKLEKSKAECRIKQEELSERQEKTESDEINVSQQEDIGKMKLTLCQDSASVEQLLIKSTKNHLEKQTKNIYIIKSSCFFPGSVNSLGNFWQLLKNGRNTVCQYPAIRPQNAIPNLKAAYLQYPVNTFDAEFFRIAPKEVVGMDPQQRILLETAYNVLTTSGMNHLHTLGVVIGAVTNEYQNLLTAVDPQYRYHFSGGNHSFTSGRISYIFGLNGPASTVNTACSSALVAINQAFNAVVVEDCDSCLTGAVNLILSSETERQLMTAGALSPDSFCKTFDSGANGYGRGEGCALTLLSSKQYDNVNIKNDVIVKAVSVNQNGTGCGITVPSGTAQEHLLTKALNKANVIPSKITAYECHGTGTSLGDPIETNSICKVYQSHTNKLSLGTVKTVLGHLEGAAGCSGLFKLFAARYYATLPVQTHLKITNRRVTANSNFGSLLFVETCFVQKCSAVSSFGFSGTNAHGIIDVSCETIYECYSHTIPDICLLTLSARTFEQLQQRRNSLIEVIKMSNSNVQTVAHELNKQLEVFSFKNRCSMVLNSKSTTCEVTLTSNVLKKDRNSVSFAFTGQGSECYNMGRPLYSTFSTFANLMNCCFGMVNEHADNVCLKEILFMNSLKELSQINQMSISQPLLFSYEYSMGQFLSNYGINPNISIGHSIGEYGASALAGMFCLDDACKLVTHRGRLMSNSTEPGSMVSVAAGLHKVNPILHKFRIGLAQGGVVSIAAVNSIVETVISCSSFIVQNLSKVLNELGYHVKHLNVTIGAHSQLLSGMVEEFRKIAKTIKYYHSQFPVISNVTAQPTYDVDSDYWVEHLLKPVRFREGLEQMLPLCQTVLEIGPQPVLMSFAKASAIKSDWTFVRKRNENDMLTFAKTLASLYTFNVDLDLKACQDKTSALLGLFCLPKYPFNRKQYWLSLDCKRETRQYQSKIKTKNFQSTTVFALYWKPTPITSSHSAIPTYDSGLFFDSKLFVKHFISFPCIILNFKEKISNRKYHSLFENYTTIAMILSEQRVKSATSALTFFKLNFIFNLIKTCIINDKHFLVANCWGIINKFMGNAPCYMSILNGLLKSANLESSYSNIRFIEFDTSKTLKTFFLLEIESLRQKPSERKVVYYSGQRYIECIGQVHRTQKSTRNTSLLPDSNIKKFSDFRVTWLKWDLLTVPHKFLQYCNTVLFTTKKLCVNSDTMQFLHYSVIKDSTDARCAPQSKIVYNGTESLQFSAYTNNIYHISTESTFLHLAGSLINSNSIKNVACLKRYLLNVADLFQHDFFDMIMKQNPAKHTKSLEMKCFMSSAVISNKESQVAGLITGGGSGIGLQTAKWLLDNGFQCVSLLGRRLVNNNNLTKKSTVLLTPCVNCTDQRCLKEHVDQISRRYSLKWIVHSAVSLEDSALVNQLWSSALKVFEPKVLGTWNLHHLTNQFDFDQFLIYSSLSSVMGYPGQCAYAAANAFQDALMIYRHEKGSVGKVINWGPWAQVGLLASLEEKTHLSGLLPMQVSQGITALTCACQLVNPQIILCLPNFKLITKKYPKLSTWFSDINHTKPSKTTQQEHVASDTSSYTFVAIEKSVEMAVTDILGFDKGTQIDKLQGFMEGGMDSMMIIDFYKVLNTLFPQVKDLTVAKLYSYGNVKLLSKYLFDNLFDTLEVENLKSDPQQNSLSLNKTEISVSVTGFSCRFSKSNGHQTFWNNLKNCVNTILTPRNYDFYRNTLVNDSTFHHNSSENLSFECNKSIRVHHCGFLDESLHKFDAQFFRVSPNEAMMMDPQQRMILEQSWHAIEQSVINVHSLQNSKMTAALIGASTSDYRELLIQSNNIENSHYITGNYHSVIAGRLAYFYGFQGTTMTIDTACSSSLVATHCAINHIKQMSFRTSYALVGGVQLILSKSLMNAMEKLKVLSATNACQTFDVCANGFARAEGVSVALLSSNSSSTTFLHQFATSAVNQDGNSTSLTAPNGSAQASLLSCVYNHATHSSLLEAHGTGTPIGDPIEIDAVKTWFSDSIVKELTIGAAKTGFGHAEACSGMVGLLKVICQQKRLTVTPLIHFKLLNKNINLKEQGISIPLVSNQLLFTANNGISSFGFSGTNAHVVLRCFAKSVKQKHSFLQILPVSAKSEYSISNLCKTVHELLNCGGSFSVTELFSENLISFKNRAVLSFSTSTVNDASSAVVGTIFNDNNLMVEFIFSGHGNELVNCGKQLFTTETQYNKAMKKFHNNFFELQQWLLLDSLYPVEKNTNQLLSNHLLLQPALLSIECALVEQWNTFGVKPNAVLGVSFGEYCAALAADMISEQALCELVALRARLIDGISKNDTGMLSIEHEKNTTQKLLANYIEHIDIAGKYNCRKVVISGKLIVLYEIEKAVNELGHQASFVGVPVGFHSRHLKQVQNEMYSSFSSVKYSHPSIPFISSMTGDKVTEVTGDYWCQQMVKCVEFQKQVINFNKNMSKVAAFIGIGVEPTFLQFAQSCLFETHRPEYLILPSFYKKRNDWDQLAESLSHLYIKGTDIIWAPLFNTINKDSYQKLLYPFDRKEYWFPMEIATTQVTQQAFEPSLKCNQNVFCNTDLTTASTFDTPSPSDSNISSISQSMLNISNIVSQTLCQILGISKPHELNSFHNIFELGMDSISLIDFCNQITDNLNLSVPITPLQVGKCATINILNEFLESIRIQPSVNDTQKTSIFSTSGSPNFIHTEPLQITKCGNKSSVQESIPLSHGQTELWFLHKNKPQKTFIYNEGALIDFNCRLKPSLLERALSFLIGRHTALKTVFKQPCLQQLVSMTSMKFCLIPKVVKRGNSIVQYCNLKFSSVPLERCPFSVVLLKSQEKQNEKYSLQCVWNHLVIDGQSFNVFFKDLSYFYNCKCTKVPVSPVLPFHDFVHWERNHLSKERLLEGEKFWKNTLNSYDEHLELPTIGDSKHITDINNGIGKVQQFRISGKFFEQLVALTKIKQTTLFTISLLAYFKVLFIYSGQTDLIVGTPVQNRLNSAFENTVGLFANIVPIRYHVSNQNNIQQIARLQENILSVLTYQDIPFTHIMSTWHKIKQGYDSEIGLLRAAFVLQNSLNLNCLKFEKSDHEWLFPDLDCLKFSLICQLLPEKNFLRGVFNYAPAQFTAELIRHFLRVYGLCLNEIVSNNSSFMQHYSVPLSTKMITLNTIYGVKHIDMPLHKTICQVQIKSWSPYVFQTVVHSFQKIENFSSLLRNARKTAESLSQTLYLNTAGVSLTDKLQMVEVDRNFYDYSLIFGTVISGCGYVPVEKKCPQHRKNYIRESSASLFTVKQTKWTLKRPKTKAFKQRTNAADVAYSIYTSGTTGTPKGVIVSHKNLMTALYLYCLSVHRSNKTRLFQCYNQTFDGSLADLCLISGVAASISVSKNIVKLFQLVRKRCINTVGCVPILLDSAPMSDLRSLKNIEHIHLGGDAIQNTTLEKLTDMGVQCIQQYGPTETTVAVSANKLKYLDNRKQVETYDNILTYISHKFDYRLPYWAKGELAIGGPSVSRGYINDAVKTANVFIFNPYATKETFLKNQTYKVYLTGDIFKKYSTQYLLYCGRKNSELKVKGYRVDLLLYESYLISTFSFQAVCAVIHIDQISNGQNLTIYFTASEKLVPEKLKTTCLQLFPNHLVPDSFLQLDSMPLTPSGKIDRKQLTNFHENDKSRKIVLDLLRTDCFKETSCDNKTLQIVTSHSATSSPITIQNVENLWATVLGKAAIDQKSNFFDSGGTSLLAMKLIKECELRFQVDSLKVSDIFLYPTIEKFYNYLIKKHKRNLSNLNSDQGGSKKNCQITDNLLIHNNESCLKNGLSCETQTSKRIQTDFVTETYNNTDTDSAVSDNEETIPNNNLESCKRNSENILSNKTETLTSSAEQTVLDSVSLSISPKEEKTLLKVKGIGKPPELICNAGYNKYVRSSQSCKYNKRTVDNVFTTSPFELKRELPKKDAVVVIAMSGRFSNCESIEEYWNSLLDGRNCISYLPQENLLRMGMSLTSVEHENFVSAGGRIHFSEFFEPDFWSISQNDSNSIDPQIRKFLEQSWYLMENSGYQKHMENFNIGVVAGQGHNQYLALNHSYLAMHMGLFQALQLNVLSTRVSYSLGLTGPSLTIDTACSTSLVALAQISNMITKGECVMGIAGGVSFPLSNTHGYFCANESDGLAAKSGRCAVFDEKAAGMVPGAGCAALLCASAKHAPTIGNKILANISGVSVNNDGQQKAGFTAPSFQGQQKCLETALYLANISASDLDVVECHGTGTQLGDLIECSVLKTVFHERRSSLYLSSAKANIGHADTASGIAGFIKAVFILQSKTIPPQINFQSPNSELESSNFIITKQLINFENINCVGVSSFGIGGTNAHAIINTNHYVENHKTLCNDLVKAFPISAKTEISCKKYAEKLSIYLLKNNNAEKIKNAAYTLQNRRLFFKYRLCPIFHTLDNALHELTSEMCNITEAAKTSQPVILLYSPVLTNTSMLPKKITKLNNLIITEKFIDYFKTLNKTIPNELKNTLASIEKQKKFASFSLAFSLRCLMQTWKIYPSECLGIFPQLAKCLKVFPKHVDVDYLLAVIENAANEIQFKKPNETEFFKSVEGCMETFEEPIFIEVGEGNYLTKLIDYNITKKIPFHINHCLDKDFNNRSVIENNMQLYKLAGWLWQLGQPLEWKNVFPDIKDCDNVTDLPNYCFNSTKCWLNPANGVETYTRTPDSSSFYQKSWQLRQSLQKCTFAFQGRSSWLLIDSAIGTGSVSKKMKEILIKMGQYCFQIMLHEKFQKEANIVSNAVTIHPAREKDYRLISDYFTKQKIQVDYILNFAVMETETTTNPLSASSIQKLFDYIIHHLLMQSLNKIKFVFLTSGLSQMNETDINMTAADGLGHVFVIPEELDWVQTCLIDVDINPKYTRSDICQNLLQMITDTDTYIGRKLLFLQGNSIFQDSITLLPDAAIDSDKAMTPEVCDIIVVFCHDTASIPLVEELLLEYHCNFQIFLNSAKMRKSSVQKISFPPDHAVQNLLQLSEQQSKAENRQIDVYRKHFKSDLAIIRQQLQNEEYPPAIVFNICLDEPMEIFGEKLDELLQDRLPEMLYYITSLGGVAPHKRTSYAEAAYCWKAELQSRRRQVSIHTVTIALQQPQQRVQDIELPISVTEMKHQFSRALRVRSETFVIVSKNDPTGTKPAVKSAAVLERRASRDESNLMQNCETSKLEESLARHFRRALGMAKISRDESFFALGGDSLSGLHLVNAIQKEYGRFFSITELAEHDSVHKLAEYMASVEEDGQSRTVVQLGPRRSGNRGSVFMLHAVDGCVFQYRRLANMLPPKMDYYGVQYPHLLADNPQYVADTLEQLAAQYLRDIMALRPKAPIVLLGSSFGGTLAYEIAKQVKIGFCDQTCLLELLI